LWHDIKSPAARANVGSTLGHTETGSLITALVRTQSPRPLSKSAASRNCQNVVCWGKDVSLLKSYDNSKYQREAGFGKALSDGRRLRSEFLGSDIRGVL